jgi:hypothetical protein
LASGCPSVKLSRVHDARRRRSKRQPLSTYAGPDHLARLISVFIRLVMPANECKNPVPILDLADRSKPREPIEAVAPFCLLYQLDREANWVMTTPNRISKTPSQNAGLTRSPKIYHPNKGTIAMPIATQG